jgi:hypothetical protein
MNDDRIPVDAERLNDAKYMLANHIASGEPLEDYARDELLACGLVTDRELRMLPNADRLWDSREWYEYVGRRWDVTFDTGEPVLVERRGAGSPPTGSR